MYQSFSREFSRNLGAGASVVAAGYEVIVKRLEPVVLMMLMDRKFRSPFMQRMINERLLNNKYYQRRLQHA